MDLNKSQLALLNKMFPEHERTSCSDEHPNNGMQMEDGWVFDHKCKRCSTMLAMKQINEGDDDGAD